MFLRSTVLGLLCLMATGIYGAYIPEGAEKRAATHQTQIIGINSTIILGYSRRNQSELFGDEHCREKCHSKCVYYYGDQCDALIPFLVACLNDNCAIQGVDVLYPLNVTRTVSAPVLTSTSTWVTNLTVVGLMTFTSAIDTSTGPGPWGYIETSQFDWATTTGAWQTYSSIDWDSGAYTWTELNTEGSRSTLLGTVDIPSKTTFSVYPPFTNSPNTLETKTTESISARAVLSGFVTQITSAP